ncbi:DUF6541 family protein [Pseudarthrobacter cellobiosi]|uniref:DUF6541 family protein n=1 Tax=Pseudarthrobacter cellobiosi TaxID=2953654 RepID=UPI0027E28D9D|nr:DUF6541 family protein [Pseudarthrobacter sp. HLT3-5]
MWLPVLPQIFLSSLLLLTPGLAVALSLRFRSFDALALAPALSVGVLVVTSTGTPFLGAPFGVVAVGVATALLATAGFFVSRLRPEQQHTARGSSMLVRSAPFAAFTVAALLLAWRALQVIGSPGSISQTYDAVFHLNSVRFALDTGQASSLTIGAMTGGGFYPAGWNAVAMFVASVTGADVPAAVNITSIVLSAVFWPLSCLLMARWIAGPSPTATLAAGIASASLGAFPLLMMDFGVLYPNLLAISVLPASIALAAKFLGMADPGRSPVLPTALALMLCLCGLAVSHPTTFMAWLVWTAPMVGFLVFTSGPAIWAARATDSRRYYAAATALAGYAIVFLILWIYLRPPEEASFWGPYHTVPQAVGEALLVSPMGLAPAWLVAPLVLLGVWACFRTLERHAWVIAGSIIFAGLFVIVSGFPISPLRNFLAGVWYNDSYRLAALLPVGAVLLVAVGVAWAVAQIGAGSWREPVDKLFGTATLVTPSRSRRLLAYAGVAVLSAAAIALGQQGGLQQEVAQASRQYSISDDSPLVSADELAVIQRLERTVPAGSTLLGNPYTGAALSYALGDRKAAQLHILSYVSPELQEIYDELGMVASDPEVCAAVKDENAYYALDFGSKEVHGGDHTPPGLKHLESNPGVELIDSQGEAKLYRITACDGS